MLRTHLFKLHRKIYLASKKNAQSLEYSRSQSLNRYEKNQLREARRPFRPSSSEKILSSIQRSRLIFLGDFHTFGQNSQNLQKILWNLLKPNKRPNAKIILCMEMIHHSFQFFIDSFCEGLITEREFLESIHYQESWRFPWSHYRSFFEAAKTHEFKIVGLNSPGTLEERDHFASEVLGNLLKENPKSKVLVLFGEYHIVENKIPRLVKKLIPKLVYTIIHQNLDSVYWKLRKKGAMDKVVEFSNHEFSIQSSPPWIKYESMSQWYENLCEDPSFEVNQSVLGLPLSNEHSDGQEYFITLSRNIQRSLNLDKDLLKDIENVSILNQFQLPMLQKKIQKLPVSLRSLVMELVVEKRSFKLPGSKLYYCPNFTFDKLAYMAGMHTYHLLLEKKHSEEGRLFAERARAINRKVDIFHHFLHQSFVAYFCAKILNPQRLCNLYQDFVAISQDKTKRAEFVQAMATLAFLDRKKPSSIVILKNLKLKSIVYVARNLGHLMAENFYNEVQRGNMRVDSLSDFINNTLVINDFQFLRSFTLNKAQYKMQKKGPF